MGLSIHHASLGSHPPLDDEDEELLDEELEEDELDDELLLGSGPTGCGPTGSGELTNSLPRHSPVSVTKQTLATKVGDCIKLEEERSCG